MQVAVFTTNTVRLLTNPPNLSDMAKWPNAVVDPDLSRINGLPPHFWRLDEGDIVPMTPIEIRYRKKLITANGMDNVVRKLDLAEIRPEMKDFMVIKALESEYNQLRVGHWVYIGISALNLLLSLWMIIKK